jgi:rhamnosyltransferase
MKVSLKKYQKDLVAVVITFNPDIKRLKILIDATLPQVASIILVDNKSKNQRSIETLIKNIPQINLITLTKNFGIAYAMNIGIEKAIEAHNSFVLLLDQDSRPIFGMTQLLRAGFDQDKNVIAVGPTIFDHRTGNLSLRRNANISDFTEVEFLISSGTMIDVKKFLLIGGFRSDYFIDHVDTEWIFRCRRLGYRVLVSNKALLDHEMGDRVLKVNVGLRDYMIYYHNPLRDYYMFRNTILLIFDSTCPWVWKPILLFRIPKFMAYFLLFGEKRLLRLRLMLKGIWHGIRSISGEFDMKKNKCVAIPKTSLDI